MDCMVHGVVESATTATFSDSFTHSRPLLWGGGAASPGDRWPWMGTTEEAMGKRWGDQLGTEVHPREF